MNLEGFISEVISNNIIDPNLYLGWLTQLTAVFQQLCRLEISRRETTLKLLEWHTSIFALVVRQTCKLFYNEIVISLFVNIQASSL